MQSRLPRPWTRLLLILPMIAWAIGCDTPAQIEWSPDGTTAGYCNGEQAMLLDEQGNIVAPLGNSTGGLAWSADSKHLYAAVLVDDADATQPSTEPSTQPTPRPSTQPSTQPATVSSSQPATTETSDSATTAIIYDLQGGVHKAIARLPGQRVVYLCLSPDGQWLAIASIVGGPQPRVHATLSTLCLASGKISVISPQAIGTCFVGKDTLAFAEKTEDSDDGTISEVKLDDSAASFKRRDLIRILPSQFGWMQNGAGDILFTQQPLVSPQPIASAPPHANLYRFNRANSGLVCVMEDVGPVFSISPSGKKILFEKDTWPEATPETTPLKSATETAEMPSMGGKGPENKPEFMPGVQAKVQPTTGPTRSPGTSPTVRRELSIMNANGSDPQTLRSIDFPPGDLMPVWPAWHGDDAITWFDPTPLRIKADEHRIHYSITDYRLTSGATLEPFRLLSKDWPHDLLPSAAVQNADEHH